MTAKYFAILTNAGAAKLANAAALGTQVKITKMGVGDGNGVLPTPDPAKTALIREVRRAALNSLSIDPDNGNQIIAEQVIPESEGGWFIREIGLYDDTDTLIAVANCPETYKPLLAEGSGRTQTVRMIIIVNSTESVTLKIDPSVVLATRKYVDDALIEVKGYADSIIKKHVDASNPHSQYLQIANALSEIKDDAGLIANVLKNLGLREALSGVTGSSRNSVLNITTATKTATFTADEIVVTDKATGAQYRLTNFANTVSLSKTGAGGVISGTNSDNGFMAIYAIYNPVDKKSALFAIDATSTRAAEVFGGLLPDGFTASALVSIWQVVGGSFSIGYQRGRTVNIRVQTAYSTTVPSLTFGPISISALVPLNAISVSGYGQSNGITTALNSLWAIAGDAAGIGQASVGTSNTGNLIPFSRVPLITPQTIYVFAYTANGNFASAYYGINSYEF